MAERYGFYWVWNKATERWEPAEFESCGWWLIGYDYALSESALVDVAMVGPRAVPPPVPRLSRPKQRARRKGTADG